MASGEPLKRKRGTPAGDSLSAETKMGQKMALVHQRISLLGNGSSSKHVGNDDAFEPTDDELAIVVGQQSKAVDDCDDPDDEVYYVPLRIVRPESTENGQDKRSGFRYKQGVKKSSARIRTGYKSKRGRPVGPNSAKSKKNEKPTLVHNSSSQSKEDKDFDTNVYMARENKFTTTDGPLSPLSFDTSVGSNTLEEESSDEDVYSKEDQGFTRFCRNTFGDDGNNLDSEEAANDGIRSPDPNNDFEAVKSFENFKIVINGLVIDHELFPDRQRRMYYKLCCARKTFLHRHLLKNISPVLAAAVMVETVNITEGIKAVSASSSLEDLAGWERILESFELLGMDVAFLRKRVDDLQVAVEEAKLERGRSAEKMRALMSEMSRLKDALKEVDTETKEMMESVAKLKKAMSRLATAPR